MRIRIDYQTCFRYAKPVSFSPHVMRVFPRPDALLGMQSTEFECPGARVMHGRDLFDNIVATCFFPAHMEALCVRFSARLEVREKNPLGFLLGEGGLRIPPSYSAAEQTVLAPYLRHDGTAALPDPLAPSESAPSVETLLTLMRWIHENLDYERRETGAPYAPGELLVKGSGACRDFAVLLAEVLRRRGVAARLASGYLWEQCPVEERVADDALHAWVEAYLPGAGWIGLDPANGVFCDHHAIATAVGITHDEIAPIAGHYYGRETVSSELEATLVVEEIFQSGQTGTKG